MTDLLTLLETLRRPVLLISAANYGLKHYKRSKNLRCILNTNSRISHGSAITKLMAIEADMNERRKEKDATYSCSKHVEILIAMLGEAQLLRANYR